MSADVVLHYNSVIGKSVVLDCRGDRTGLLGSAAAADRPARSGSVMTGIDREGPS
jgi:hypothetical protein